MAEAEFCKWEAKSPPTQIFAIAPHQPSPDPHPDTVSCRYLTVRNHNLARAASEQTKKRDFSVKIAAFFRQISHMLAP